MATANVLSVKQPKFAHQIQNKLAFPLQSQKSTLQRGYMIWDAAIQGYGNKARVDFLFNPTTVEADYPISDSSVGASLMFPNAGDNQDLAVPLYQTVEWSLLFDRTYELWGQYDDQNNPADTDAGSNDNNPAIVGVLADIYQMRQFTGMNVGYTSSTPGSSTAPSANPFYGYQGIVQIIPSWVFFGNANNLAFYGYVSEWDMTITHWTQAMVPMRCVIDISWTLLPPAGKGSQTITGGPGSPGSPATAPTVNIAPIGGAPIPITSGPVAGVGGR